MANNKLLPTELLSQLELFKLRARRSFLGSRQGGHASLKRGHGIEFSDYRKYELGDDPRHIDWGVYARSERLYVKRFQEEEDLSVSILLDNSPSMFTPVEDKKWDLARSLALAVAYVALMQQDRVMISIPQVYQPPFMTGGRAFHSLLDAISKIERPHAGGYIEAAQQAISRMNFPGVAVFISDFLMPFEDLRLLFQQMQSRNLDITALQVLGEHDLNPNYGSRDIRAIDSETGEELQISLSDELQVEYEYVLNQHNQKLSDYLHENNIGFTQVSSSEELNAAIIQGISNTGLFR